MRPPTTQDEAIRIKTRRVIMFLPSPSHSNALVPGNDATEWRQNEKKSLRGYFLRISFRLVIRDARQLREHVLLI